MVVLYGARITAATATRALILLQLAMVGVGLWLGLSYEEDLLPKSLLEIKDDRFASSDPVWTYVAAALVALYIVSLVGLFLMAAWGRWLYTVLSIGLTFYPFFDWSSLTIQVDLLAIPSTLLNTLDGALLAIIWLNAWSGRGVASAAEGVDSPR